MKDVVSLLALEIVVCIVLLQLNTVQSFQAPVLTTFRRSASAARTSLSGLDAASANGFASASGNSPASTKTKEGFRGGGGGMGMGGGSSSTKKNKKSAKNKKTSSSSGAIKNPDPKSFQKQLQQKYGGTTPQDIARGTQALIDEQIATLPPPLQQALHYHRQLLDWDRRLASMDLLAQAQLSPSQVDQMKRMRDELAFILANNASQGINITTRNDLQVLMQQITWNASADAKAIKSVTGNMPKEIQHRVERACQYAAEAIVSVSTNSVNSGDGDDDSSFLPSPRVLDVGCGYGVLVPYLQKAGISKSQIHGVDLSADMIRNAQRLYPSQGNNDVQFDVANFMDLQVDRDGGPPYACVIFCASLHDLPDMKQALIKARDLLVASTTTETDKGSCSARLIVVHPHGASHVAQQHKANPVLVPRTLPTSEELKEWLCCTKDQDNAPATIMELVVAPAGFKSQQEIREGYLAVLELSNHQ